MSAEIAGCATVVGVEAASRASMAGISTFQRGSQDVSIKYMYKRIYRTQLNKVLEKFVHFISELPWQDGI
jgi:hypothetical protein